MLSLPCRDLFLEETIRSASVWVFAMVQQVFDWDGSWGVSGVPVQLIQCVAIQQLVGYRLQVINVILAARARAEPSSVTEWPQKSSYVNVPHCAVWDRVSWVSAIVIWEHSDSRLDPIRGWDLRLLGNNAVTSDREIKRINIKWNDFDFNHSLFRSKYFSIDSIKDIKDI